MQIMPRTASDAKLLWRGGWAEGASMRCPGATRCGSQTRAPVETGAPAKQKAPFGRAERGQGF